MMLNLLPRLRNLHRQLSYADSTVIARPTACSLGQSAARIS